MKPYSDVKDVTMTHRSTGPGMAFRKKCSVCDQPREILGGSLYTRLKLWRLSLIHI